MAAPEAGRLDLPRVTGRLRPVNAVGPIAGSVFTVLAWAAIAHNSGSGWVQALGVMLGAVLLVGILAPGYVISRTGVAVQAAPADGIAGDPLEIEIAATTRVRVKPVAPAGRTAFVGPGAGDMPTTLEVVPARRGMLHAIEVEIASAAPFGILWWSRRTTLALPTEVCVAPKPTEPLSLPPENDDSQGDSQSRRPSTFGETRGARPYQHGDSRRAVNWRASAHTGRLMVREMEAATAEPVTVRVVLPADNDEADQLAARAFATVLALMGRERPVMLATHEPTGDRLALVTGAREAGRRLARAVPYGSDPHVSGPYVSGPYVSGSGASRGPGAGRGWVTIEEPPSERDRKSPQTPRSTDGGRR
jgi:uncharacterized protein (DUF58 family)